MDQSTAQWLTRQLLDDQPLSLREAFLRVCHLSQFVEHVTRRHTELVHRMLADGVLDQCYQESDLHRRAEQQLDKTLEPPLFDSKLRAFRQQEMLRIVFRDFSKRADLIETTRDLSALADECISRSLDYHTARNIERYGAPTSADGKQQQMSVLALGKLGANELNLSSDVDLVFFYDQQGTTKGTKQLSNQEFFLRTSRQLIASIQNTTEDGFVFRVDMRLRPYGDSGALILHRAAMEKYFVEQGRDWERYAFIKARPIAGDKYLGDDFLQWLKPFIYRKHLDYGAIESLREMKRLIDKQVELKELHDDIKLGPGGIREVEFIVQAHQLIFGGRLIDLQERRLLKVLPELSREQLLPAEEVQQLMTAYIFLRNSEHAIQGENDKQTQRLPESDQSRQCLYEVMAFENWESYYQALQVHREFVRGCFANLMAANQGQAEQAVQDDPIWQEIRRNPEQINKLLAAIGYEPGTSVAQMLRTFSMGIDSLQDIGLQRINRLMPRLLRLVVNEPGPESTMDRVLKVLESILRRSTYLAFLLENPASLQRLVELCALSSWVSDQLREYPILLYELSVNNIDNAAIDRAELQHQLDSMLMVLDEDDLEAQMDTLRQFKNAALFRIAVFELLDLLPLMKASDSLTHVAETVLQKTYDLAWRQLAKKHGTPSVSNTDPVDETPVDNSSFAGQFAMIAYGKLGGIELAYGSDLDLVFLFDSDFHGDTNGRLPINNNVFYSRLAKRIIHILTTFTRFGILYEVDMRLRPSGNKGPMVSTLPAYERYLDDHAWTWELQALVRARFVAGNDLLGEKFTSIRNRVLAAHRDKQTLRRDVVRMRENMRQHLSNNEALPAEQQEISGAMLSGFDLKHDIGAIVDIEFMVQYAVLAWSHEYPRLTRWTDKMRLLDELGGLNLYTADEVQLLQQAYLAYRSVVHYQWLGGEMDSYNSLQQYRSSVYSIWQETMAADG